MRGAAVVPGQQFALATHVFVDDLAAFAMVPQQVEQRIALLVWQAENFFRHQPVHVDRLAAGVLICAEDRMLAFGECRRALAVAALGRAVIVMMQRLTALEPRPHRRIERVIGGVATGEQRVAAGGWNLHRIEQRRLARHLGMDHVVVEHHLAIGQHPDRFSVLPDVGDQHDAGQDLGVTLGKILWRARRLTALTEIAGHAQQVFLGEILLRKYEDEVVEPGLVDRPHRGLVGLGAQIEAAHLRADVAAQGNDVEPGVRPCGETHGVLPRTELCRWVVMLIQESRLCYRAPCIQILQCIWPDWYELARWRRSCSRRPLPQRSRSRSTRAESSTSISASRPAALTISTVGWWRGSLVGTSRAVPPSWCTACRAPAACRPPI